MKRYLLILFFVTGLSFISSTAWTAPTPDTPLVSVVMPVYNRQAFVTRTIDSILKQTYKNFEFIIVDDGSTDNTYAILSDYAKKDKRIKLLRNDRNRGISYTRNKGNAAATGTYIAVMDSDDVADTKRLEKQVTFLETHPDITAVNSTYFKTTDNFKTVTTQANNWVPKKRLDIIMNFNNYFTHPSLIRRDFLLKHHIRYNEHMISSEDYNLWADIILAGGQLLMLNDPLMTLRRHHDYDDLYYQAIKDNRKLASYRLLNRFHITPTEVDTLSSCDLLKKMISVNPTVHVVDQDALVLTHKKECTTENLPMGSLYLKHTDWIDNLIPTGPNTFKRENAPDTATLLYKDLDTLVLLWSSNNREETFTKQTTGAWQLSPIPFKP